MNQEPSTTYRLTVQDESTLPMLLDILTSGSTRGRGAKLCARLGSGRWRTLRVYADRTDATIGLERVSRWLSGLDHCPSWSELRQVARNPMPEPI
jgi:hypothetical protein